MTLQLARDRRLQALKARTQDKVLVKPGHYSQIIIPETGTVASYMIDALRSGCQVEQLEVETGWSRSQVLVNLYKLAKKTGFGIRRRSDTIYLILPGGASRIFDDENVVNAKSEERVQRPFKTVTSH